MKDTLCPCGSLLEYEHCCAPIIKGEQLASSAVNLMRSRYTAFTKANMVYLMQSHHSLTRPLKDRNEIARWARSVKWKGLTIIRTEKGGEMDEKGLVEFMAMYTINGSLEKIHETSLFEREEGKWVYVSGQHH